MMQSVEATLAMATTQNDGATPFGLGAQYVGSLFSYLNIFLVCVCGAGGLSLVSRARIAPLFSEPTHLKPAT